jgi:hypothetical protein
MSGAVGPSPSVTQLRMNLDFGSNSGKAMTQDIRYCQDSSRWEVMMDLGSQGAIAFGCEQVRLEYVSSH